MTRKEQIENAANNAVFENVNRDDTKFDSEKIDLSISIYTAGFKKGAMWADKTPGWHLFPKELPPVLPITGSSEQLWLAFKGSADNYYYRLGVYKNEGSMTGFKTNDCAYGESFSSMPIAWMELPKFSSEIEDD